MGSFPQARRVERWVLGSARLTPYDAQEGKWFWLVHFYIDMDQSGSLNEIELVVLMDGRVLKPEKERR